MSYRQPRIRVSGMLWHGDRLLLVRQGRPESPRWMLPGGGVEAGEAMAVALERELREEIGLVSCRVGDPVAMVESIAPPSSRSGRHLLHVVFRIDCEESCIADLECRDPDVKELRLFDRADLLGVPIHPPIAGYLSQWRSSADFAWFGPLWAP